MKHLKSKRELYLRIILSYIFYEERCSHKNILPFYFSNSILKVTGVWWLKFIDVWWLKSVHTTTRFPIFFFSLTTQSFVSHSNRVFKYCFEKKSQDMYSFPLHSKIRNLILKTRKSCSKEDLCLVVYDIFQFRPYT